MIVDDNEIDIFIHEKLLSKLTYSYETVAFNSVESSLNYLKAIPQKTTFPELIFIDINMPIMNGYDFIIKYNELDHPGKRNNNIVLLSNHPEDPQLERVKKNKNVLGHFLKPLKLEDLKLICEDASKQHI